MNFDKLVQGVKSAISSESNPDALGRGVGIFSLALGITEVVAPKMLADLIGVDTRGSGPAFVRAMGARKIGTGLAVLLRPNTPLPLWARVAGDAMDLTFLALASRARRASGTRLAITAAAVAGVTALDVIASLRAQRMVAQIKATEAGIEPKPAMRAAVPRKTKPVDNGSETSVNLGAPDLAH